MSKASLKKLTFDDIVAKKLQRDKEKFQIKEIEVPSMGGTLSFEKPKEDDIFEAIDLIGEGDNLKDVVEAYDKLIYNCCPTLKDTKLQEQLEIQVPYDIVKTLLDLSDRMTIGDKLIEMTGMSDVGTKIKN